MKAQKKLMALKTHTKLRYHLEVAEKHRHPSRRSHHHDESEAAHVSSLVWEHSTFYHPLTDTLQDLLDVELSEELSICCGVCFYVDAYRCEQVVPAETEAVGQLFENQNTASSCVDIGVHGRGVHYE